MTLNRLARIVGSIALALLCALPITAQEPNRTDALTALASPDVEARKRAIIQLAKEGVMADSDTLARALRDDDAVVRNYAEQALWIVWSRSGDPKIDEQFADGLGRMQAGVAIFARIIAARPDFSEGWNKRATIYFLMGELDRSLADCHKVLTRNPVHFGVLAGYGQIYAHHGEMEKALEFFKRALAVNPNMEGVRMNAALIEQSLGDRARKGI
ncbi:MAG: tetratricopeptide repeat protein [Betaproteobacteria bacterium]|nr:tetratricopeptide repeat protein [Betaproteobacteria bacterium]